VKLNAELEGNLRELHAERLALKAGKESSYPIHGKAVTAAIHRQNKRMNEPRVPMSENDFKTVRAGSGISRRVWVEHDDEKISKRRKQAPKTFSARAAAILREVEHLLWSNGYVEIDFGRWLIPKGGDEPYSGFWWYSEEIGRHVDQAKKLEAAGRAQEAMLHAFEVGELIEEFRLKAAHDEFFERQERIVVAQVDYALSRRRHTNAERQERWRHYRTDGHKKTQAGILAGQDLGCSEATIRNAFGGTYPHE